jgi:hypothetical protein
MQMSAQNLDPDEQWVLRKFPDLAGKFRKTSDKTDDYNCLAWALGLTRPWICPFDHQLWPKKDWPTGIREEWSITTAREVLGINGYIEETKTQVVEPEWEKVAIFGKGGDDLQHFARQLPNGKWTSKLGMQIDIEHHDLECLKGQEYGELRLILKRRRNHSDQKA